MSGADPRLLVPTATPSVVVGSFAATSPTRAGQWTDPGTNNLGLTGQVAQHVTRYQGDPYLPDLRMVQLLHRSANTFFVGIRSTTVDWSPPSCVSAHLQATVHGGLVRVPLSGADLNSGALGYVDAAGRLFRLRYAHTVRPDLFADLTPVRDPFSAQHFGHAAGGREYGIPGVHFEPGITDPDPWATVADSPELMFHPYENGGTWCWREKPSRAVIAEAAWDDLDQIAQLAGLTRDPDAGRVFAWLHRKAREELASTTR